MKKKEFDQLKEQTRKNIDAICKEYPHMAVHVVISQVTYRAGFPGERSFTESQLKELFDLADEYAKEHKKAPEEADTSQEQGSDPK